MTVKPERHENDPLRGSVCEQINPYDGDKRAKGEQVREMFDNIAPAYDLMNRMMTLGIDRRWRRKAVGLVRDSGSRDILDVATGTGDLAMQLARDVEGAHITGIDLSDEMLAVGRRKVTEAGLAGRVTLSRADCLDLPMADESFDAVTVAFGVRNFEHLLDGYREMHRVLRPGGMLCVIELSEPSSPLVRPFYKLYTRCVIPAVGRMVSHDRRAYAYLPESIAAVPQGLSMTALMSRAGFANTRWIPLTLGVCSIYIGYK